MALNIPKEYELPLYLFHEGSLHIILSRRIARKMDVPPPKAPQNPHLFSQAAAREGGPSLRPHGPGLLSGGPSLQEGPRPKMPHLLLLIVRIFGTFCRYFSEILDHLFLAAGPLTALFLSGTGAAASRPLVGMKFAYSIGGTKKEVRSYDGNQKRQALLRWL